MFRFTVHFKRWIVFTIFLMFASVFFVPASFAQEDNFEASIWYIGNGSDADTTAAKNKLSSSPYSWVINYFKSSRNAGNEPTAYDLYNNSDYSDVVYISGHGYENHTRLPLYKADNSISTWLYVSEKWAGSYPYIGCEWKPGSSTKTTSKWNGDLEWAILGPCNQLNLSTSEDSSAREWARVLCGDPVRMHAIVGYTGLAPGDGVDTEIINEFFDYANKNNGYTILNAWIRANNNHYANWAAIYHAANKSDHFHGQGSVTGDTDPNSDPDIKYLRVGGSEQTIYSQNNPLRVLQNKHSMVEVKATIPDVPPELSSLLLSKMPLEASNLALKILGEEKFKRAEVITRENGTKVYKVDESYLEVFPTGGINYDIAELDFTQVLFDEKTAVEKAKEFLTSIGVDTTKLVLSKIRPIQETTLDLTGQRQDITTNIAYQVEFIRLVNGLPLANGDGVRVILDNSGVKSYTNGLRLIQGVGKPQKVISVDRAFSELESKLHLAFNMPEKVEITDIKLVYYVSNMGKAQSVVHPAWAFKLSENNYAYVDAFTGTILLDY